MRRDDRVRLQHMLDAAREAISFAQGRTRSDLDSDRKKETRNDGVPVVICWGHQGLIHREAAIILCARNV